MTVHIAIAYALTGAICATLALRYREALAPDSFDMALLCLVWPLYGPLMLLRGAAPGTATPTPGGSLAELLPDLEDAALLEQQLDRARNKVGDIDQLLLQTEFDREHACWHRQNLLDAGQEQAAARVDARLANIDRLHGLRARYAEQLAEIEELLVQLRLQAAVVRLSGWDDDSRELVTTLLARVEGLDALMEEGML